MNILIDGTLLTNTPSGIGIATISTINEIAEENVDVTIIVRRGFRLKNSFKNISYIEIPKKVPRIFYIHFVLPYFNLIGFYDWVWVPSPRVPIFYFIKNNYAITYYDSTWKFFGYTMRRLQSILEKTQIPFAIKKSRIIFCISNSVRDELLNFYPNMKSKILVTYMSLPKNMAPNSSEIVLDYPLSEVIHKKYFLFVGNWEPRKNLKNTILAFLMFVNSSNDYYLVVAGKKRDDYFLDAESDKLIFIDDYIDESIKNLLISRSIGVIYPSLYEGFGIPILEANAHRKFILCSDIPVMHEVANNTAIYADPNSLESLCCGFESLSSRKSDLTESTHSSDDPFLNNLRRFSWKTTAQTIIGAFRDK